jgi:sec-independent protein translocase protein TatC
MLPRVPSDNGDGPVDELGEGPKLSFIEHLEELRRRILACLAFFALCFFAAFFIAPKVIELLIAPLTTLTPTKTEDVLKLEVEPDGRLRVVQGADDLLSPSVGAKSSELRGIAIRSGQNEHVFQIAGKSQTSLFFLSPIEPFTLLVKGAFLVSLVASIPFAIYQLWLFIAPGLLPQERRIVKPILLASLLLFPLGAGFAYAVSHVMLKILLGFSDYIPGLQPNIVASHYLSFILTLMLGFGLVFEFPLVLILLARIGVVNSRFLIERRKYAILVIAIIAAAVTPTPDALNMLIMMAPLLILYEISIWVIRLIEPKALQHSFNEEASETD